MERSPSTGRQRVWLTTAQTCEMLGMTRETLRQLRLRGVLRPDKHFRRWGCTQGRGPLQWHSETIEATLTGWSRRNLPY
ncbi:MAG: DNA-binding protein [Aphanocapsa feldmannii 288cV]|nr:MAG: DNA-binding protein [Aphanocapsa feldmannii 288cV]